MAAVSTDVGALIQIVVFCMEERRYALPLGAVERIVRAVEVTPLPGAPAVVLGAIDLEGRVLPVLNLRRRSGLPQRDINPADHFLIAHTAHRTVALAVDAVQGVREYPATEIVWSTQIVPGLEHIQGVVKLDDGLLLIHDPEAFLSLSEAGALDDALGEEVANGT